MKRQGFSSMDLAYFRRNSEGSCRMLSCRMRSFSSALFFEEVDSDDTCDNPYTSPRTRTLTERGVFGFSVSW